MFPSTFLYKHYVCTASSASKRDLNSHVIRECIICIIEYNSLKVTQNLNFNIYFLFLVSYSYQFVLLVIYAHKKVTFLFLKWNE